MSNQLPYEEKNLLLRISNGDAAAFEQLMNQSYTACYQTALLILRDAEQAKDIVQETFLKVWLRRSKLNEIDNFGGWLRSVTVNLIYDYLTRRKRQEAHLSQWMQEINLPQVQNTGSQEEINFEKLIDEAIDHLPAKQRETFILIKKQGHSRQEAANIQGVSSETVKTNLERAMRSIRAYCLGKLDNTSFAVIFSIILKIFS